MKWIQTKALEGVLEKSIYFWSTLHPRSVKVKQPSGSQEESEQLRIHLAQVGTWDLTPLQWLHQWMNGTGHLVTCPSVTVTFRSTYCAPQFWRDMEPHRRVIASGNKRNLSLTGTVKLHRLTFPAVVSPALIFWKLISNKQEIPRHCSSQDPSPLTKGKV